MDIFDWAGWLFVFLLVFFVVRGIVMTMINAGERPPQPPDDEEQA
jgi:hypothetical protein